MHTARERFVEGFVTASLVFCVGPLTILGALSDGLGLGASQLILKATLDGFAAIAFAASLGLGVMASAVTVAVVQGALTLVGFLIGDFLPAAHLAAITATGGLLAVGRRSATAADPDGPGRQPATGPAGRAGAGRGGRRVSLSDSRTAPLPLGIPRRASVALCTLSAMPELATPADAIPRRQRAAILRAAIGLGLYAGAFGASFGAVSVGSGLSVAQTMLLSLVMFSGASQFAFVGVVAAGSPLAAIPAALLLGVRNAFYGVTLSEILNPRGWRRLWTAHFVIDETTAMAVGQSGRSAQRYAFWATGLILCGCWQTGSLGGALIGTAVDPAAFGLDAAAPAVFLALLWPALKLSANRWVGLAGAALALALVPIAPPGVPVVAAAGVAVVAGLLPRSAAAVADVSDGAS